MPSDHFVYLHILHNNDIIRNFISNLHRVSINTAQTISIITSSNVNPFNNSSKVEDIIAEVICYIFIFNLTSLISPRYLVKHKSAKFFNVSGKTVKHLFCQNFAHRRRPGPEFGGTYKISQTKNSE